MMASDATKAEQVIGGFEAHLRHLLGDVALGGTSIEQAFEELRHLPLADLGYARIDHHRELRSGFPEIVYAPGKAPDQLRGIVQELVSHGVGPILITRATDLQAQIVRDVAGAVGLAIREEAGAIAIVRHVPPPSARIAVVTAGTADLGVAGEAHLTATLMGCDAELYADVGVAGLHRLLAIEPDLARADAIVVVAGMEGALASVVGGLVSTLVVACPTSTGYGAGVGGFAALLSMLNACTPNVVCVNIDDGVGAGYAAALVGRARSRPEADRQVPEHEVSRG